MCLWTEDVTDSEMAPRKQEMAMAMAIQEELPAVSQAVVGQELSASNPSQRVAHAGSSLPPCLPSLPAILVIFSSFTKALKFDSFGDRNGPALNVP